MTNKKYTKYTIISFAKNGNTTTLTNATDAINAYSITALNDFKIRFQFDDRLKGELSPYHDNTTLFDCSSIKNNKAIDFMNYIRYCVLLRVLALRHSTSFDNLNHFHSHKIHHEIHSGSNIDIRFPIP